MGNYTPVPDVAVGQAFPPSLWESAIMNNINLGVARQLADTTLTGPASSIDFTGLPTGVSNSFAHLMIEILARGDTVATATALLMRLNNDSGADYNVYNDYAGQLASQTSGSVGALAAASAPASAFSACEIVIPYYAQATSFKTWLATNYYETADTGGGQGKSSGGGIWKAAAAAINRITFLPGAGNFISGTRITVYGLPA